MKFEDKRIEFAEWAALKPKTPWGALPLLEVGGKTIGQSMTISRYLAREGGLVGKNSLEQASVEEIVDVVTDFREKMVATNFGSDEAKAAATKEFGEKTIPSTLPALEKYAAANKEKPGVFVGSKMTLADIHFFAILEILVTGKMPTVLSTYPNLKKVYDGVAANPKIAEYIKKRPATPF